MIATRSDALNSREAPCSGHFAKYCGYLSFRIGKGPRIRLPDDPSSQEFRDAYVAAMAGETTTKPTVKTDGPAPSAS